MKIGPVESLDSPPLQILAALETQFICCCGLIQFTNCSAQNLGYVVRNATLSLRVKQSGLNEIPGLTGGHVNFNETGFAPTASRPLTTYSL